MRDTNEVAAVPRVLTFAERIDAIHQHRRRSSRRQRLIAAVLVLGVVGALLVVGVGEHRHHFAGATVSVTGSWLLHEVDHDGRPTVTAADLVDYQWGVPAQFTSHGQFLLQGCVATIGSYHVSLDQLSFSDGGAPAVACGYATADAERVGTDIAVATNAAYESGAVVSAPTTDQLEMTVRRGEYVLLYVRDPSPRPSQLLPS